MLGWSGEIGCGLGLADGVMVFFLAVRYGSEQ